LQFSVEVMFVRETPLWSNTMSKKHKGGPAPIPKGNQSKSGPDMPLPDETPPQPHGAPASEQDPKRRLGNYGNAGEHPIEQPGGKQGADHP